MILAPITVNDMLKFLSEDLRTNIEKVVESGDIDAAHKSGHKIMSKVEGHKKGLEMELELCGDVDQRKVTFSDELIEFLRRFDSMLDEDTDNTTSDSKKEAKSKAKVKDKCWKRESIR